MTERPDPYDLDRFVAAQRGVYEQALSELRAGRKQSHWMWFIFPQIQGLGASAVSRQFAIKSLDEARAYLTHATLGPRLIECAGALLALQTRDAGEVLGYPDNMKLKSSATLFALVSSGESVFDRVLQQFFNDERDQQTLTFVRQLEQP